MLIVQHMPELFTRLFAERLNGRCPMQVREAAEGDPVRPGTIYIAKGNWHMEVLAAAAHRLAAHSAPEPGRRLRITAAPPSMCCSARRPRSTAAGVLAVVLTGMGSDGMLGCRIIRDQGGSVLAQDQATSAVWGMPGAVTNAGLAHKVLPLNAIAPEILRLVSRPQARSARASGNGGLAMQIASASTTAIFANWSSASRRMCSTRRAITSLKRASPSCCATRA